MKKLITLAFSLVIGAMAYSQTIEEVQALGAFPDTKLVALLSDHTIWWGTENKNWEQVPSTGLPAGKTVKSINVYVKLTSGDKNSRLVAVLDDNTVWWYVDKKSWEKVSSTGLPKNTAIKLFRPYIKRGSFGGIDTRFVAVLEDNTMWWYALDQPWKQVSSEGLPAGYVVTGMGTYQKVAALGGSETRYIITLADNSVWWYADGKKWQQLDASGMPAKAVIKKFGAFMKISGDAVISGYATWDGRLVSVLQDESIWWLAASNKTWQKLTTSGLPKGYKVRSLSVFQKFPGMLGETRVILLLEDNSIWWYSETKGWSKFTTDGLPAA